MIIGIGIDQLEIDRIDKQLKESTGFKEQIFNETEITYCDSKQFSAMHYAARFAAKEALMKALGTGWSEGIAFAEIEIRNDHAGRPHMHLHGKAQQMASDRGVRVIHASLTHTRQLAAAVVLLEG